MKLVQYYFTWGHAESKRTSGSNPTAFISCSQCQEIAADWTGIRRMSTRLNRLASQTPWRGFQQFHTDPARTRCVSALRAFPTLVERSRDIKVESYFHWKFTRIRRIKMAVRLHLIKSFIEKLTKGHDNQGLFIRQRSVHLTVIKHN